MKRIFAIVVLTIISLVTSCMMDTIEEVNKQYEEKIMISKSVEKEKVTLNLNVINNADNITLKIKNYQFINVEELKGIIVEEYLINYSDSIHINSFKINKQVLSKDAMVVINGELINGEYELYDGLMFIPISGNINKEINTINLELYPNCPWFDKSGGKLLVPITFDLTVEGWENENIVIQ